MRQGGKPHIDWARGPVKHPRRNLEPATRRGAAQRTAENDASCLPHGRVNGHAMPEPGMPGIHNRTEQDPVGVLKPCCTTKSASTRASAIARRGKFTSMACGYVDDRRCRPAPLPPFPERARAAAKCSPSPTSPQAPQPTRGWISIKSKVESLHQRARQQRSEPISKPVGLHLKKRLRLSHDWGPPQTVSMRRRASPAETTSSIQCQ